MIQSRLRNISQQANQSLNKAIIRGASYFLVDEKVPVPVQRKRFESINRIVKDPVNVALSEITVADIPVEVITPPAQSSGLTIIYLHGGAFCVGSPRTHRGITTWMATKLHAKVYVPDYRLAPEHPYPAAVDDCVNLYEHLMEAGVDPSKCIIAGDSAGGNLTLVTLLKLKDAARTLPGAAILYSPWVDLRCNSESYVKKKWRDPMLNGPWLRRMQDYYCPDANLLEPYLSPINGDLSGLPPLLVHVGSDEISLDDSLHLERAVRAAGGEIHLKEWAGLWHVYQANAQFLASARLALFETRDFIHHVMD